MLRKLLRTDDNAASLVARVTLGAVILPHGAQKLLGWFGGYGPAGTVGWFESALGVPAPLAWGVILSDSLGSIALILGLFGRVGAVGAAAVMAGAIALFHWPYGFFMNWEGTKAAEGFEFHLLAIGLAAVVALQGSGRWSLDRWIVRRLETGGERQESVRRAA